MVDKSSVLIAYYMSSTRDRTSSIEQAMKCLKRRQYRGDYKAAAAYGDALPAELRALPKIALERARIRMRQGCVKQAEVLLDQADVASASPGEQLILSLEKASLQILSRLAVTQALEEADAALETFSEAASSVELAEAQRVYIRILLNAAIHKELAIEEAQAKAAELPRFAEVLESAGFLDEGLTARFTYADNLVGEAWLAALEAVANQAEQVQRPQVAGEAYTRRAERLLAIGGSSERINADLEKAAKAYEKANHVIGPIDIRRVRAQLAIERELTGTDEWVECLAAYRLADYPKGAISLLMDLSQLAHESGNTSLALSYRQQSLELAQEVGMGMVEDNYQLALVDLLIRNNQYGAAIEICEAAIESDLPRFSRGNYEQLLSTVYSFVRNLDKSIRHGRRAIDIFESVNADGSATIAVVRLASDLDSFREEPAWDEAEQLLTTWIAKDIDREDSASALQKQELLAQIYLNRYFFSDSLRGQQHLLDRAEGILAESEELAHTLEQRERAKRLGAIYQLRGQIKQAANDFLGVEQTWQQALSTYEAAGMDMEAANCHYVIGALRLNMANQQLMPNFGEAESRFNACLDFYERAEMRGQAADTHFMMAQLYVNAAQRIQLDIRQQMLEAALNHLAAGEFNYDAIRRDFYAGSALEAQQSKQTIIKQSRRLYDLALEILLYIEPDIQAAWQWGQRAKARTLGDTLGTASVTPARILAQLEQHPDSLDLFRRERELAGRISKVSPRERTQLREELTAVREHMAQDPNLKDYLEIRTGIAFDLDDVDSTFPTPEDKRCVCVDWIEGVGELWLFVLKPGQSPEARRLHVRVEAVKEFVNQNLSKEAFRSTLRDDPEILEDLSPLVTPLADLTNPGDLLILSPTGPMHALPLHAFLVEGRILIERNPIVYCPSLNVLRHCLARSKPTVSKKAALFGDPNGDREAAAELVSYLGRLYQADYLTQDQVTRAAFIENIPGCDIIHFQGHAVHDASDPLNSYLKLADGQFTARDIFSLQGLDADIVTLGACESAANVIDTGDEPLGLIPSFLFAGGSAVLASLWKVNSKTAAQFMRDFYEGLAEAKPSVNKAEALQRAMLKVRDNPRFEAPYYWAPFVLHGDWR
ncbi:MAG: CHAT domain-containing protein [Leptolyngbyaceae cyanobacterium MO_188.B28]|nr:CHAT domain-containing protein [Leptolyngbyaceae cyanobacterium MO_188.B28]